MRPVYLEFCGVNSFSEKTEIDFRKLLDGGLFGIFGDTGSGKSTILDCIHFALYGKIERSSGTESINYKCDKAYVIYDFELTTDGRQRAYRVQRERRRKNNVVKAWLYEYDEKGSLQGLADGTVDVTKKVEEIIGLGFDDFKKCIALPQGEFSGLVKAEPSKRLELVSRLFELEKYGDKLSKAVRVRCAEAESDMKVLLSQMQENAEGSEENIKAATESFHAAAKTLAETEKLLAETESALAEERKRADEKKIYDGLCGKLKLAEEKLAYYSGRREKAERFSAAVAVNERDASAAKSAKSREEALSAVRRSEAAKEAAEADLKLKKRQLEESGIEREIEEKVRILGTLEGAAGDVAACEEARKKYRECKDRYREIKDKVPAEDFPALLAANEAARAASGEDESFTEFLRRHFKDVLLSEAYAEFCADLKKISAKYPETEGAIAELVGKYRTAVREGAKETFDVAAAQKEFKAAEETRRKLKAELDAIESRKRAYEDNEREKKRIEEDGKYYGERLKAAEEKIAFVKPLGTPDEVKKHIETLKAAKKRAEDGIRAAEEKANAFAAEAKKQRALAETYAAQEREAAESLQALLKENGFSTPGEARALAAEIGDGRRVKAECEEFFDGYNLWKNKLSEIPAERFDGFSEEKLLSLGAKKAELAAKKEELLRFVGAAEQKIARLKEARDRYAEIGKEAKEKEKEKGLWEKLRALTDRGKFMEFIASEYLQEICVSASKTLLSLTGGRYFLRYGDEFKAGDNLNGGALRSVRTLSGGETFLVSLSLALALSGAICAKSLRPIEFFFLDEGFGTLDEKLIDTVMDVLEKLRSRNFSIGVISHVEELKHRIDRKILVTGASDTSGSRVRIEAY